MPILKENGILLTIEPKDHDALRTHPLMSLPFLFVFHDTTEGRAKKKEVEQALKTKSQVTITNEHMKRPELPDIFSRFIDINTTEWKITVGALPPRILAKVEMQCTDGESACFDYVDLERFDEDDGTTIYRNENQPVPWRIEVKLDKETKPIGFSFKPRNEGVNVNWDLQAKRFQCAMAKGGILDIRSLEWGLPLFGFNVKPGLFDPPDVDWFDMLEKLFLIQQKTFTVFQAPTESLDEKQVEQIYQTAFILDKGRIEFERLPFPLKVTQKEGAQELLKYANQEHFAFGIGREEVVTVLNQEISLGYAIYKMGKVALSKEDWQAVKLFNETAMPDGGIEVTLTPLQDSEIVLEFSKWLPKAEAPLSPESQEGL